MKEGECEMNSNSSQPLKVIHTPLPKKDKVTILPYGDRKLAIRDKSNFKQVTFNAVARSINFKIK